MPLIYVELFRVEAKGQKYEFIALDAVSFFNIIITTSGRSRSSEKGGGGGSGHPDPEIRGGPSLKKIFFWPFGSHFGLKIRWRSRPPRPLPWICH